MDKKWSDYKKDFKEKKDIEDKVSFLQDLILELKISPDSKHNIFADLKDLDLDLSSFNYLSLDDARNNIKNKTDLQKFESQYKTFIVDCKDVLSSIFDVYLDKISKLEKNYRAHNQYKEILKLINKNNYPVPLEIREQCQDKLDEYTASLDLLDPEITEKRIAFNKQRKQLRAINKKTKKKTKEVPISV